MFSLCSDEVKLFVCNSVRQVALHACVRACVYVCVTSGSYCQFHQPNGANFKCSNANILVQSVSRAKQCLNLPLCKSRSFTNFLYSLYSTSALSNFVAIRHLWRQALLSFNVATRKILEMLKFLVYTTIVQFFLNLRYK